MKGTDQIQMRPRKKGMSRLRELPQDKKIIGSPIFRIFNSKKARRKIFAIPYETIRQEKLGKV